MRQKCMHDYDMARIYSYATGTFMQAYITTSFPLKMFSIVIKVEVLIALQMKMISKIVMNRYS